MTSYKKILLWSLPLLVLAVGVVVRSLGKPGSTSLAASQLAGSASAAAAPPPPVDAKLSEPSPEVSLPTLADAESRARFIKSASDKDLASARALELTAERLFASSQQLSNVGEDAANRRAVEARVALLRKHASIFRERVARWNALNDASSAAH